MVNKKRNTNSNTTEWIKLLLFLLVMVKIHFSFQRKKKITQSNSQFSITSKTFTIKGDNQTKRALSKKTQSKPWEL